MWSFKSILMTVIGALFVIVLGACNKTPESKDTRSDANDSTIGDKIDEGSDKLSQKMDNAEAAIR